MTTAWAAVAPDVVSEILDGHRGASPGRAGGLRIGGLFEGYSGLTMGVREVLGGDLAWYSDIDPGALKILGHHHPGVLNLGDITAVDWSTVEPVDVMCGGFPCQDVSAAGKRAGLRPGTRSGLWAHFAYAIDQLRPGLVVIENVRGLLTARGGPVTEDLAMAWAARDLADRLLDHLATSHAIAVRKGHTDHARDIAARRARVVGLRRAAVARARRADRLIVRALGAVLGSLDDLGYDAAWHGLRAADPEVGGCHGRFRVFIFAWPRPAADAHGDGLARVRRVVAERRDADRRRGPQGPRAQAEQSARAALMPTPTASDRFGAGEHGDGGPDLRTAIALLPTPAVNDMGEGKTVEAWDAWTDKMKAAHGNGNGHGASLAIEAQRLLPTPRATDGTKGGPNQRGSSGDLMLPSAVQTLLPTPTAREAKGKTSPVGRKRDGRGRTQGDQALSDAVDHLLPTRRVGANRASRGALTATSPGCVGRAAGQWSAPGLEQAVEIAEGLLPREYDDWTEVCGTVSTWGDYDTAVRRWSTRIDRDAPPPTETAPMGGQRLSPRFVEWMMGLPGGWVVDVPGITRNEALKALGNGVVPQQAAAALREVLTWAPVREAFGLAA